MDPSPSIVSSDYSCGQYLTKPLKWLRYIMAAAVGCEGELVTYTEVEDNHEGYTHPPIWRMWPLNVESCALFPEALSVSSTSTA